MADGRLYLDTSAYLCVLLGESGTRKLEKELRGARLLSSVMLVLEANRSLIRLSREAILTPGELSECLDRVNADQELFLLRELSLDLCRGIPMPVVSTPRSLDLIHLRTALWFHEREPIQRFVSLDRSQEQAARELGLPV